MELSRLYAAIDDRPFRPFTIQLIGGREYRVSHPDNIFVLPSRQKVFNIEIYDTPPWGLAVFGPQALQAILFDRAGEPSSS